MIAQCKIHKISHRTVRTFVYGVSPLPPLPRASLALRLLASRGVTRREVRLGEESSSSSPSSEPWLIALEIAWLQCVSAVARLMRDGG